MHNLNLYVQSPTLPNVIYNGLLETAGAADFDKLTVTVAYITKIGCKLITKGFSEILPKWGEIKKTWLISFDLGITEPDALEFLMSLPNSTVWISNAEAVLNAKLRPRIHFHSKLYIFERQSEPLCTAVFSTSANITANGLLHNTEQAISAVWSPPLNTAEKLQFRHIKRQKKDIDHMFAMATPLNKKLLTKYRRIWRPNRLAEVESSITKKVLQKNPVIDIPEAIALATASSFWVRVTDKVVENRGKGRPGNQIDLHQGARVFFGFGIKRVRTNTVFGSVRIKFKGAITSHSMRFGNNSMDKINLPILNSPYTYAGQILLFKNNNKGFYELQIGSARQAARWHTLSQQQNTQYSMKSGREYGVFT